MTAAWWRDACVCVCGMKSSSMVVKDVLLWGTPFGRDGFELARVVASHDVERFLNIFVHFYFFASFSRQLYGVQ